MKCPRCQDELRVESAKVAGGSIDGERCDECGGLFVLRATAPGAKETIRAQIETKGTLRGRFCSGCGQEAAGDVCKCACGRNLGIECPNCAGGMHLYVARETVLDVCSRCGGVWFDADELEKFHVRVKEVVGGTRCTGCMKSVHKSQLSPMEGLDLLYCAACHADVGSASAHVAAATAAELRDELLPRKRGGLAVLWEILLR